MQRDKFAGSLPACLSGYKGIECAFNIDSWLSGTQGQLKLPFKVANNIGKYLSNGDRAGAIRACFIGCHRRDTKSDVNMGWLIGCKIGAGARQAVKGDSKLSSSKVRLRSIGAGDPVEIYSIVTPRSKMIGRVVDRYVHHVWQAAIIWGGRISAGGQTYY